MLMQLKGVNNEQILCTVQYTVLFSKYIVLETLACMITFIYIGCVETISAFYSHRSFPHRLSNDMVIIHARVASTIYLLNSTVYCTLTVLYTEFVHYLHFSTASTTFQLVIIIV